MADVVFIPCYIMRNPDADEDGWTDEDFAWNEEFWARLSEEEDDAENA